MSVVRVFTFRTVRPGFDAILRGEMMPELREMAGLIDVFFGRQGPDDVGPRIVVSAGRRRTGWSQASAIASACSIPSTSRRRATMPSQCSSSASATVSTGRRPRSSAPSGGSSDRAKLDAYVDEVRDGVELDRRNETGPTALYLGATDAGEFITASAWREWDDVARSTGGSIHDPNRTRHPERLVSWSIEHYEIVR